MRRYGLWLVSALVALPVYALASVAELDQIIVLIVTFIGAMAGAILANNFIPRR